MRAQTRVAFGKPLADQGVVQAAASPSRASQIEQARLLTLKAAWLMDTVGKKGARIEIAAIKVVAARARDRRDRPRHPGVRRRRASPTTGRSPRCTRTRARCTSSTVPTRCTCSRSPAASSRRTSSFRPGHRAVEHEDPDRVRARHAAAAARRRRASASWSTRSRRYGFDSLWLLGARQRARSPTRWSALAFAAGRTQKLKLGTSVQVLPGPQPGAARQGSGRRSTCSPAGARSPRSGSASSSRSSSRRSASTREDRAPWFDEALAAAPPPLDRGHRRPRRPALPLRGRVDRHPAGPATARRLARRARPGRAAPRRPARRRLAPELLHARAVCRGRGSGRGRGRRRAARSTPSTTARWCSTRTSSRARRRSRTLGRATPPRRRRRARSSRSGSTRSAPARGVRRGRVLEARRGAGRGTRRLGPTSSNASPTRSSTCRTRRATSVELGRSRWACSGFVRDER